MTSHTFNDQQGYGWTLETCPGSKHLPWPTPTKDVGWPDRKKKVPDDGYRDHSQERGPTTTVVIEDHIERGDD